MSIAKDDGLFHDLPKHSSMKIGPQNDWVPKQQNKDII